MRVLIIDENYPKYLQSFYLKNNTSSLSYSEHYNLLLEDHFANNGSWIEPLAAYGYDVVEVYFNNDILQNHWLAEFGNNTGEFAAYKKFQTVFLQIQYYKPEILYISNPHYFDEDVLKQIKAEFPYIKVYACYLGTPYTAHAISEYDICFTTISKYSNDIQNEGKHAYRMPPAFNKQILQKLKKQPESITDYKLCFAGGMVRSNDMHARRLEYIEALAKNVPMEIYSEIYDLTFWADFKENFQKKAASVAINSLKKIGFSNNKLSKLPVIGKATRWDNHQFKLFPGVLKAIVKPAVYGMDMYNTFASNKVVFNIHVSNAGEEAGNMRLFEATGAGACLLTDAKSTLSDFFAPDEEVVTYSSKEECIEKAQWLINNPDNCRTIALAGTKRLLKDHTYENRAPIFVQGIKDVLGMKK